MNLNNCPLCGSEYVDTFYMDGKYFVSCENCDIRTHNYDSEEEAQAVWNNLPIKANDGKRVKREKKVLPIKFHLLNANMEEPKCHNGVCYDIAIPEQVVLRQNGFYMIPLGFSCKLPDGYHAELFVRSSTPKNYKFILANSVGIVDPNYCGKNDQWMACIYYLGECEIVIPAGTRLFQFKLVPNPPESEIQLTDQVDEPDRGGFGSTGL